jgi:4-coumarate--CoA ligase
VVYSLSADVLIVGYGLTETSPTMMIVPRQHTVAKVGSAGTLMAGLEVRLVGEDDEDAPMGGPGEIWVRGPSVMKVLDV